MVSLAANCSLAKEEDATDAEAPASPEELRPKLSRTVRASYNIFVRSDFSQRASSVGASFAEGRAKGKRGKKKENLLRLMARTFFFLTSVWEPQKKNGTAQKTGEGRVFLLTNPPPIVHAQLAHSEAVPTTRRTLLPLYLVYWFRYTPRRKEKGARVWF